MNPSGATGFEWDDANREHLLEKGIREWEVEEVFQNGAEFLRNRRDRAGDYSMAGRTNSGKRLTIMVKTLPASRELRAITGWTNG